MNTSRTPTPEQIREFVIAGHGDLAKVKAMLAQDPLLLNARQQWAENDYETATQAAAHVGNAEIAEYLLTRGAPLEICTAATLGRRDAVTRLLDSDRALIRATGAHGIPLMAHAALSGNVDLVQTLFARGVQEGMSFALVNAVSKGHVGVARAILDRGAPDLGWKNYQGKTALDIATARDDTVMIELLKAHGAR